MDPTRNFPFQGHSHSQDLRSFRESAVSFAPNTNFQNAAGFEYENTATLQADIDYSGSLELCAFRVENHGTLPNGYYSQWEVDAEDAEQRRILEDILDPNDRIRGMGMMSEGYTSPAECLTPGLGGPSHKKGNNDQRSQFSESNSHQILWQGLEAHLYKAYFEKRVEKDQKKSQGPQKDDPLWMYRSTLVKGKGKDQARRDSQAAANNRNAVEFIQKTTQKPIQNIQGIDQSVEKTEIYCANNKLNAKANPNCSIRFNVMVAGQSGVGKSTFVDCFLEKKYNVQTSIRSRTKEITEKEGIKQYEDMTFRINFVDTPGYKPDGNINKWYKNLKKYMAKQFINFKTDKNKPTKDGEHIKNVEDKRVHILLYFMAGPRMNDIDIFYMKKLAKFCNIVPVLAKGDSYIGEEVKELKAELMKKINASKIELFDFTEALKEEPEKLKQLSESKFGPCPPFLIISSVNKIEIAPDTYIYGREYTWGICNIEDPNHSDFSLLQILLGGFICDEAITQTNFYYKDYFMRKKQKMELLEEKEKRKTLGMGALFTVGLLSACVLAKNKLLS